MDSCKYIFLFDDWKDIVSGSFVKPLTKFHTIAVFESASSDFGVANASFPQYLIYKVKLDNGLNINLPSGGGNAFVVCVAITKIVKIMINFMVLSCPLRSCCPSY